MNLLAEFARIWGSDAAAKRLCPSSSVFTGRVPDSAEVDGVQTAIDPPYISITVEDGLANGGTSAVLDRMYMVQISAYATTRAAAEKIRNHARDLFEDCQIKLGGLTETFQDCSIDESGELPEVNGVFHCFQRFQVETTITRPRRKRV